MIDKAISHLNSDKVLKKVISRTALISAKKSSDLYLSLLRAIVGQQLSVKAAATIWQRFLDLFPDQYPQPENVLQKKDEDLRAVGLSFQKAGYIKNIARFSIEETLDFKKLRKLGDEELIEYLLQIKGVGRWTAEMILMFALQRPDVFPVDDLGIQNGMRKLYLINITDKKKFYARLYEIAEKWRPYRSLACMYIWKFKDEKLE